MHSFNGSNRIALRDGIYCFPSCVLAQRRQMIFINNKYARRQTLGSKGNRNPPAAEGQRRILMERGARSRRDYTSHRSSLTAHYSMTLLTRTDAAGECWMGRPVSPRTFHCQVRWRIAYRPLCIYLYSSYQHNQTFAIIVSSVCVHFVVWNIMSLCTVVIIIQIYITGFVILKIAALLKTSNIVSFEKSARYTCQNSTIPQ